MRAMSEFTMDAVSRTRVLLFTFLLLVFCVPTIFCVKGNVFKVAMTQKGYIQFLRYPVEVPDLFDFTSCIWIKSHNSSHPQSILSYSRHESERLIRLWISPHGFFVNLEIAGVHVMRANVGLRVGRWYHICQSWSSVDGLWGLYRNGYLVASGEAKDRKIVGRPLPGHGDIVVGQEYTDFDKGLEDGVEGEVFGFNLLVNHQSVQPVLHLVQRPVEHVFHPPQEASYLHGEAPYLSGETPYLSSGETPFGPQVSGPDWNRRASPWQRTFLPRRPPPPRLPVKQSKSSLEFVRQCFKHCLAGRGSPSNSPHLLVAWARTPVRVFGGAVMKNAMPFCGGF